MYILTGIKFDCDNYLFFKFEGQNVRITHKVRVNSLDDAKEILDALVNGDVREFNLPMHTYIFTDSLGIVINSRGGQEITSGSFTEDFRDYFKIIRNGF